MLLTMFKSKAHRATIAKKWRSNLPFEYPESTFDKFCDVFKGLTSRVAGEARRSWGGAQCECVQYVL